MPVPQFRKLLPKGHNGHHAALLFLSVRGMLI